VKFLKEDGTVEDGEPLKDHQAAMLTALESYLHMKLCRHAYHGYVKPCYEAAHFLMITTTTIDESEWGEVIDEKVNPKPIPEPAPEPVVLVNVAEEEAPL
jgi:hypothetical protein